MLSHPPCPSVNARFISKLPSGTSKASVAHQSVFSPRHRLVGLRSLSWQPFSQWLNPRESFTLGLCRSKPLCARLQKTWMGPPAMGFRGLVKKRGWLWRWASSSTEG